MLDMRDTILTVFKTKNNQEPHYIKLGAILDRFKNEDKNGISNLSALPMEEYKKQKGDLPGVCFGGWFAKRANSELIKHSGLMILDVDDIGTNKKSNIKEQFIKDEFIYSFWESPSGRGLKALVRIPECKTDSEYKLYYQSFAKRYDFLDTSGKDISRLCFFCYDPDLHQKESKVWNKIDKKEKITIEPNYTTNNYKVASKVLNIIRNAVPGERHDKILKASRLMGGYVSGGEMTYEEAFRLLLQEANVISDEHNDSERDILDGLKHGMQDPLTFNEIEKEVEQTQSIQKFGKIYFRALDKREELDKLYQEGNVRGYEIGFKDLNNHYTVKLGSTTYVYGAPASGKTQIWFEFLINLSVLHGLNHVIFSPETGNATEIFAELISMVAKGDFTNTYKNQIPMKHAQEATSFVHEHFFVVDPEDNILNHKDFFNYVDEVERVYNKKIHTSTIDPFNEFKQDLREYSGRQDFYLEHVLTEIRQNAKLRNRHNCIITHVQDQQLRLDKSTNTYFYPQPTYREIAGGQAWSRKGMSMLSVWRPKTGLLDENGYPYEFNQTVLEIQKSKPKGTGKVGIVNFLYDSKKHRYTDQDGLSILKPISESNQDHVYSEPVNNNYKFDVNEAMSMIDNFDKKEDVPF